MFKTLKKYRAEFFTFLKKWTPRLDKRASANFCKIVRTFNTDSKICVKEKEEEKKKDRIYVENSN